MVVGERVGGPFARREERIGRGGRHVGAEGVDGGVGRVLDLAGLLDVEEVLLAPGDPFAVALARDGDGEAVDERHVDACDGEAPAFGAGEC